MLARCARVEPARMRAPSALVKPTCSVLSFSATDTSGDKGRFSVPFAPLMVTRPAAMVAVTPCGNATGFLATRDMIALRPLRHDAEDFAALADGARLTVGHHALRRGDDD